MPADKGRGRRSGHRAHQAHASPAAQRRSRRAPAGCSRAQRCRVTAYTGAARAPGAGSDPSTPACLRQGRRCWRRTPGRSARSADQGPRVQPPAENPQIEVRIAGPCSAPIRPVRSRARGQVRTIAATIYTPAVTLRRAAKSRPHSLHAQLLLQQIIDDLRIGLSFRRLHHVANQKPERVVAALHEPDSTASGLAATASRTMPCQRVDIADLRQALRLHDARQPSGPSRTSSRRRPWRRCC